MNNDELFDKIFEHNDHNECVDCDKILSIDECIDMNGEIFCEDCFNENYSSCLGCGQEVIEEEINYIDGDPLCDTCAEDYEEENDDDY